MTASCGSGPPPPGEIRAVPVPTWREQKGAVGGGGAAAAGVVIAR